MIFRGKQFPSWPLMQSKSRPNSAVQTGTPTDLSTALHEPAQETAVEPPTVQPPVSPADLREPAQAVTAEPPVAKRFEPPTDPRHNPATSRKLRQVLFYGNCQAGSLELLLQRYGADLGYKTAIYKASAEASPEGHAAIRNADVIIEQIFTGRKKIELQDINPHAKYIRFPGTSAQFLWPYATTDRKIAPPVEGLTFPFAAELSDSFLDQMANNQVAPAEAARRYAELDIVKKAHIDRLFEMHMMLQRERDSQTEIPMADALINSFSGEVKSFHTRGHPWGDLYSLLAGYVLEEVGLPGERVESAKAELYNPPQFPPDELPIHPAIIEHFAIKWQDPAAKYNIYEDQITWEQWAERYVRGDCNAEIIAAIDYIDQKDYARSLDMVARHRNRTERLADVAFRLEAFALLKVGQLAEASKAARAAYSAALANPSTPARSWGLIGRVAMQCGCPDTAEQAYIRGLALQPNNYDWHKALQLEYRQQNRNHEALAEIDACASLRPWADQEKLARFEVKLASGELDDLATAPGLTANQLLSLAQFLNREGRHDEAVQALNRAIALQPFNVALRAALGHTLGRTSRTAEAEGAFRNAIALAPQDGALHRSLGHTLARQKRFDECLVAALKAVELNDISAESRAFLAGAYRHLGQLQEAAKQIEIAVSSENGGVYQEQREKINDQLALQKAKTLNNKIVTA